MAFDLLLTDSITLLRLGIPLTDHMIMVAAPGIIISGLLLKAPGVLKQVGAVLFVVTLVATAVVGVDDMRGGDLFNRVANSECTGWSAYVDLVNDASDSYGEVIDAVNSDTLTVAESGALLGQITELSDRFEQASPPDAASDLHVTWVSILDQTEAQLMSFRAGGTFEVGTINALIDSYDTLVDDANASCG